MLCQMSDFISVKMSTRLTLKNQNNMFCPHFGAGLCCICTQNAHNGSIIIVKFAKWMKAIQICTHRFPLSATHCFGLWGGEYIICTLICTRVHRSTIKAGKEQRESTSGKTE